MNSKTSIRAIFLAGLVLASSAFAADINKCVGTSGTVTLTDAACPAGAQTVKVISGPAEAPPDASIEDSGAAPVAQRPSVERYSVARLPVRYAARASSTQPARGLSLDIATLKTARLNMHLIDNAAQSMRSQRLAGLQ